MHFHSNKMVVLSSVFFCGYVSGAGYGCRKKAENFVRKGKVYTFVKFHYWWKIASTCVAVVIAVCRSSWQSVYIRLPK